MAVPRGCFVRPNVHAAAAVEADPQLPGLRDGLPRRPGDGRAAGAGGQGGPQAVRPEHHVAAQFPGGAPAGGLGNLGNNFHTQFPFLPSVVESKPAFPVFKDSPSSSHQRADSIFWKSIPTNPLISYQVVWSDFSKLGVGGYVELWECPDCTGGPVPARKNKRRAKIFILRLAVPPAAVRVTLSDTHDTSNASRFLLKPWCCPPLVLPRPPGSPPPAAATEASVKSVLERCSLIHVEGHATGEYYSDWRQHRGALIRLLFSLNAPPPPPRGGGWVREPRGGGSHAGLGGWERPPLSWGP